MQMPNFQPFDKHATPTPGKPFVTIQRTGKLMSLNKTAYELLNKTEAVELNYDPDQRLIGMRPVRSTHPRAYVLRQMGKSNTWTVALQAFTQYWGIDTDIARRYSANMYEDYLVVDIKEKGVDVTGPRSRIKNAAGLRSHVRSTT